MSQRYAKVFQREEDAAAHDDDDDRSKLLEKAERSRKLRRRQQIERLNNKIHAFLWVVGDAALLYGTDFLHKCLYDYRVNRVFFNIAVMAFGVFFVLVSYAVMLSKDEDVEITVAAPRVIPAAAIFGVVASLCFLFGLWPVFGLFTPFILGCNFIASIMACHFLPSF
jgi:hypothetical protein